MHKFKIGDMLTLKTALAGAGKYPNPRMLPRFQVITLITHECSAGTELLYRGSILHANGYAATNYLDHLEEELAELPVLDPAIEEMNDKLAGLAVAARRCRTQAADSETRQWTTTEPPASPEVKQTTEVG